MDGDVKPFRMGLRWVAMWSLFISCGGIKAPDSIPTKHSWSKMAELKPGFEPTSSKSKTRSLQGRELFNCDLQQWHSAKVVVSFFFSYVISVCPFAALLRMPKIRTLFSVVDVKNRSVLTSWVFWFVFLNASSHLFFGILFCFVITISGYVGLQINTLGPSTAFITLQSPGGLLLVEFMYLVFNTCQVELS